MAETYDSVMDRIGAFNLATESLSKGRFSEVGIDVAGRPECRLRLAKTEVSYAIELTAASVPAAGEEALAGFGFKRREDVFSREVRKSERSWNVASQIEDILVEVLGLPSGVTVTVETVT